MWDLLLTSALPLILLSFTIIWIDWLKIGLLGSFTTAIVWNKKKKKVKIAPITRKTRSTLTKENVEKMDANSNVGKSQKKSTGSQSTKRSRRRRRNRF